VKHGFGSTIAALTVNRLNVRLFSQWQQNVGC